MKSMVVIYYELLHAGFRQGSGVQYQRAHPKDWPRQPGSVLYNAKGCVKPEVTKNQSFNGVHWESVTA